MWGVWIYDLDGKGGGWWIDTTGAVWGTADQLHAEAQAVYLSERAHRVATARQFGLAQTTPTTVKAKAR